MTEEKQESTDFELMDREDEEQILAELRGAPMEKFIYKNNRGQFELSYAGTKWAVREMANTGEAIRVELPKVERCPIDPEYIIVNIIGKRIKIDRDANCETMLDTNVGSARGWIKQRRQDGSIVPDEFFYNKTVSKATRNVQQALMPSDFKRKIIDTLIQQQGGNRLGSGRPAPRPPQGQRTGPSQNRPPNGVPIPPGAPVRGVQPPPPAATQPRMPGARLPAGGFAGEVPFPASPSQGQLPAPPRPPARPTPPPAPQGRPAPPPPQQQRPPARPTPPPPPPAQAPVQQNLRPQVPHQTQSRPDQTPGEAAIDVLRQRFEVVLKQACHTNDRNVALQNLYYLTGYQKIADLPEDLMKEMGPILNHVAKGILKLENYTIADMITGEVLYPKPQGQYEETPQPQAEPAPEPAPVPEAPPEAEMF